MSKLGARAATPKLEIDRVLGLKPAIPQYAAGRLSDARVWVPNAKGTVPDATAAADPLLEPPGVWSVLWGFLAGEGSKKANSVVWTFPRGMAPIALRARTISASAVAGGRSWSALLLHLDGNPCTSMISLTANGMP